MTDEAYSYDQVGNRTSSAQTTGSWSYNQNNELQNSVAASYEYDANGNTIKKTVGTGSAPAVPVPLTTLYHYDARNRLTEVTLPDGTTARYAYDPFGRRVKKAVDTTITRYTPGNIGFLHQYFSALAIVTNGAPGQSNLTITNVQAKMLLPPGEDLTPGSDTVPGDDPLRMAKGDTDFFHVVLLP